MHILHILHIHIWQYLTVNHFIKNFPCRILMLYGVYSEYIDSPCLKSGTHQILWTRERVTPYTTNATGEIQTWCPVLLCI